ncbi:MAG: preprotein translocase subunit YajC [bacterium]|nr:preprotein translocase subunit YajC [bacterium]
MHLAFIAQAASPGGAGGLLGFLPLIAIMVVAYFLMIRPQIKRQKEQTKMLSSLRKNDDVITVGGLHGRIIEINEKDGNMQVQLARGIVVTVERSSVSRKKVFGNPTPEKTVTASDEKPPMAKAVSGPTTSTSSSGSSGVITAHASQTDAPKKPRYRHRPRRSGPAKRPEGSSGEGA